MTKTDRLVVVLGMHRSGTSAITRALDTLGVQLGDDLHPPGFDNPKGFWEDRAVIEINEALLGSRGSEHSRLGFAWKDLDTDAHIAALKQRAIQLLTERLETYGGLWGFKDPRTCRLLSFWLGVFQAIECRVYFIIAVRNPMSVAASLAQRNALPAEKSYLLWLQHTLPTLLDTAGTRRVVVDYDRFLDAPFPQLQRIAATLELPIPDRSTPSMIEFERTFLDAGLRHTCFSIADLQADKRTSPGTVALYDLLCRIASDEAGLGDAEIQEQLAVLDARIAELAPLVDCVNRAEDEMRLTRERERLLTTTLAARQGELEQQGRHIDGFRADLDGKQRELDLQGQHIAGLQQEIERYRQQTETLLGRHQHETGQLNSHIEQLNARIAELEKTVE